MKIKVVENEYLGNDDSYKKVIVTFPGKAINMYLYDECNDLDPNNQLLCLCLLFNEMEEYEDAEDYLVWCTHLGLDPAIDVNRHYHMDLRTLYPQLCELLGQSENPISSFDFSLNAGAAQELRRRSNHS